MSKSAHHFGCSRKARFISEEDANKAGLRIDASRMRSYYCQQCGGWHLTGHGRVKGTEGSPTSRSQDTVTSPVPTLTLPAQASLR